jgi:hypothetical protein
VVVRALQFLSDMNTNLNAVQRGMHVVDAAGKDVGTVELIRMGDAEAQTTEGNDEVRPAAFDLVARALGGEEEPDVPEPLRSRLVRSGYLKVDGKDLLDTDRYVSAEYVSGVADDKVRLSVRREELIKEE